MGKVTIGGYQVYGGLMYDTPGGEVPALLMDGPSIIISTKPVTGLGLPQDVIRVEVLSTGLTLHPGPTGLLGGLLAGLAQIAMNRGKGSHGSLRVVSREGPEYVLRGQPDQLEIFIATFKKVGVPLVQGHPTPPPKRPATVHPASGELERVEALERLSALKASGALTQDEFDIEKARVMGGTSRSEGL